MLERSIHLDEGAEQPDYSRADIGALYELELPGILGYLRRKLGHAEEAADLAHDVFFRLVRIAPTRAIQAPEAYLRRIAANLLRDRAEKLATRMEASVVPLEDKSLPANGIDAFREIAGRQELDRVHRSLAKLKPVTRQVFLLNRVDGLSYREIQERLTLSEGVVKAHMRKAIAHIARLRSVG